jgi:surface carbohydrate biosynthesis protein
MGLRGCYVAALAKSLRVKIILTYIDNNNWDLGLSTFLNRRVVCVQNATRPRWYVDKLDKCFDCYLVYSPVLADPEHGLKIFSREALTVGHLKLGIFFEGVANGAFSLLDLKHKSIVWISTYREREDYEDEVREKRGEYIRIMQLGVNYMARYAAENGYEARVALSSHKKSRLPSRETACLSEGTEFELTFSSDNGKEREWISYKEVWASELVVGINSTLLFESAALGKRTVFFLPTEDRREALEQVAPLSVMQTLVVFGSSYEEFAQKCDHILRMPSKKYDEIINNIRQKVCFLDPIKLPQERIKQKLQSIVEERPDLS